MVPTTTGNKNTLKYVSLITLTLQNAILALSMRHARTRVPKAEMFYSSTGKPTQMWSFIEFISFGLSTVVMAEVTKLITCLVLVFYEEGKNAEKFGKTLRKTIIENKLDTLLVCVPSFLYVIQNNLLYVSSTHLDAATNQVTYQLKILTTAIFAVIILRKKLLATQWGSLVLLVAGVAIVQVVAKEQESVPKVPKVEDLSAKIVQNPLIGFSAALGACVLSGFAGIFFEKMLKGSDISVWMRNVQMSLLSIPLGFMTCMVSDFSDIRANGFFHGYDGYVAYIVLLQACGGLIVAMVVKYADNILKGFATSLSIIISSVASIYLFGFNLTIQFAVGAGLVIGSIFLYGYVPSPKPGTKTSNRNLEQIDIEKDVEVMEKLVDKV